MSLYIGIDVGTRFVKIICLEYKKKYILKNAFLFPTPYSSAAAVNAIDPQEFFNQLTASVPIKILKNSTIGVNIPSSLVTVVVVNLPRMNKKEMAVATLVEAKRKMVPTPGPNSIFEYIHIGEVVIDKTPQYEVLVIKTEKTFIDEVLSIFSKMPDTNPALISPTCYTVLNFYPKNSPIHQVEVAFVNIGYESIDITIAKKGGLNFYRNVKFGLKDIINHIGTPLGLSVEQTEKVIMEQGIPEVDIDIKDKVKVAEEIMRQKYETTEGASASEINPLELRMLWETEIDRIVNEIRRTLIYYKDQTKGGRVDDFIFFGGGAIIKGMIPVLKEAIIAKIETADIYQRIEIPEASSSLKDKNLLFTSAASIALSLPLLSGREKVINFLPDSLKRRRLIVQRQLAVLVVLVSTAFVFLFSWLNFFVRNNNLKRSLTKVDREMEQREDVISRLDQLKREKTDIDKKSAQVQDIIVKKIDMPVILEEIAAAVSNEIVLERLSSSAQSPLATTLGTVLYNLRLEASCIADYEETLSLAKLFQERLIAGGIFLHAVLDFPQLQSIRPAKVFNGEEVVLTDKSKRIFYLDSTIERSNKSQE